MQIRSSAWRSGGSGSTLVATLVINGVEMHLQAIEVVTGEGPVQRVVAEWDEALALMHQASGADGHFETVKINGREWVLVATPYC